MTSRPPIFFDLDETLCERNQSWEELLTNAFERVDVEQYCTPADLEAVVHDVPTATSDVQFYEYWLQAAADHVGASPEPALEVAQAYDDLVDHSDVSLLPGATEALEMARERGPVGLITNGAQTTQLEKLAALDLVDAFDVAVYADPDNGVEPKPHTAPFERALDALGADPQDALHVGNSLQADIAGAHAAGLDSAWVPYGEPTEVGNHSPTHVLDSLAEFNSICSISR